MKKIALAFVLVLTLILPSTLISAEEQPSPQENTEINQQESIRQFYEANNETYINQIPQDILAKHQKAIEEIDSLLLQYPDAITSVSRDFDLAYYLKLIQIGVKPYLKDGDPLKEETDALIDDISNLVIKKTDASKKVSAPRNTILSDIKEEAPVRISLNGNSYNVATAINYAYAWTQNYLEFRNPDYNYYAGMNDCTNFVSQVLYAGGISQIRNDNLGYDYDDPDNWYYANSFNNPPSHTWGGAHNLYQHLDSYSSNVRRVYSTADLQEGDIVQWDLYPNDGEFHIGHSTVVTKISGGTIYLTYHTTDREDEPIDTLFNSGYYAYAWAINH